MNTIELGLLDYCEACSAQRELLRRRQRGLTADTLIFVRHNPVVTIGRSGSRENILLDVTTLKEKGIAVFDADRGGDVTYHGPEQLVVWSVVDLKPDRKDIRKFLELLESVTISVLQDFGVDAESRSGLRGVWVEGEKICSIGIGIKNWVTYHGLALNVDLNREHLGYIIPCGLKGVRVTSIKEKIGFAPAAEALKRAYVEKFTSVMAN